MKHRKSIETALKSGRLTDEERIVLTEILANAYGRSGAPLGRMGAVSATRLAMLLLPMCGVPGIGEQGRKRELESVKRLVRTVVNRLIIAYSIPICCEAGPGGGYYLPGSDEEIEANHRRFHSRAMTGLMKATRARKGAYADAMIQLTLGFESREGEEIRERLGIPRRAEAGPPAWVNVVTKLLDQVKSNPQAYADQIRELQEKFGDIFVPRHRVERLRRASAELQRALEGIG